MADETNNFVVIKKGEAADPKAGLPYDQAVPEILRGWETDKDLELFNCEDGSSLGYEHRMVVSAAYAANLAAMGQLDGLEVRDSAGNSRPVTDLGQELEQLRMTKSAGIYYEPQKMWLLAPPDMNPDFDQDVEALSTGVASSMRLMPDPEASEASPMAASTRTQPRDAYPAEVSDAEIEFLPGISGDKVLDATIGFVQNCHPVTRVALGMVLGVAAYKSMGVKGLIALVLLAMALKKVMNMGSKVIENCRLDLVARSLQDGIPVNGNGKIDTEFLDALRNYPAGDHEAASRTLDPSVLKRQWPRNRIFIQPDIQVREHEDTVQQVVDGDTLYGTSGAHYRLAGIDTPELLMDSGAQPGAQQAWDRVRELIPNGSKVRIEVVGNQPTDRYGRLPVYVYAKDAEGQEYCLNKRLLDEGLARITNFDPYHPKMEEFIKANMDAIENKVGLWNKRFNPALPRSGLLSVNTQTSPNPAGGDTISFSMS